MAEGKGILSSLMSYLPARCSTQSSVDKQQNVTSEACCSKEEPLEREDLGRNTWGLLHTMAAYLPEQMTSEEKNDVKNFMSTLGKFYPCDVCAHELSNSLKKEPPDLTSRSSFCQWMCRLHNGVNLRLGKPQFDCSKVDQRWKDGWSEE